MIAHLSKRYQTMLVLLSVVACVGAFALAVHVSPADLRWMMKVALISETVLILMFAWVTSRLLIRR